MARETNPRGAAGGHVVGRLLRRVLGSRAGLLVALAVVLIPLVTLVVMQYRWLAELERTSRLARSVTLFQLLGGIEKEINHSYSTTAAGLLKVPASYLADERLPSLARMFEKSSLDGVRRVFVFRLQEREALFFYDPATRSMSNPEFSSETLAIWTAVAPWMVMNSKQKVIRKSEMVVDEREREYRMILSPIIDDAWHVAGVAGIMLDPGYFEKAVLPAAIGSVLPVVAHGKGGELGKADVRVWDGTKRVLYGKPLLDSRDLVAIRQLSWVFRDVRLGVTEAGGANPDDVIRRAFVVNVSLSVALSLVLLAGVVVIFRVAAREMKLSAMKSDFVSNVSHELRTPLASIRMFGELMRLGRVGEAAKVREYGDFIETESRRLTNLVDNILDFSRIESGRKVYAFAETDLEAVVRGTVEAVARRTRHQGFTIAFAPPAEPLPPVTIDAAAIDQSVTNLLDNAVKYSGESRAIEVSLCADGDRAVVAVADHGIGIERDECRRIFERFHRVSTGLVHEVRGAGLGLAIVKHIVNAHGGTVDVESEPGRGSVFSIRLPLARVPREPDANGGAVATRVAGPGSTEEP